MGLGTQVRLKWLLVAGWKDMLAGAGRSDVLPLRELITSQGGLAIRRLTREAVTPGQELGEAADKKITKLTRRTFQEPGVPWGRDSKAAGSDGGNWQASSGARQDC